MILDKLEPYLQGDIEQVLQEDPEIILVFSTFVEDAQALLSSMSIADSSFTDISERLLTFYPHFFSQAEAKFTQRFERITSEQQMQEQEKCTLLAAGGKKKGKGVVSWESSFAGDIVDFVAT